MRVPFFVGGDLLKKIFIFLLVLWCTAFNTFARDRVDPILEKGEKDDKGVYTSGVVFCTTDLDGYLDYQYQVSGVGLYVVKSADGTSASIYCSDWMKIQEFFSSDGASYNKSSLYSLDYITPYRFHYRTADSVSHFKISSSIPVFIDDENLKDNVNKYLENGDCSGAENVYDVSQPSQDDSVELPKNLRTYGNVFEEAIEGTSISSMTPRYNAMTVRWDPPEDIQSYSYDVKIQVTYSKCTGVVTGRVPDLTKTESTSAEMVVTDYPYANRGTYDLTTGKEIARGDNQPEDYVINGDTLKKLNYSVDFNNMFPRSLKVWVRNRKGDKCSNWVAVSANASMPSGSDSKARVEDNNGNKVDNDTYNDTPVDNTKQNTYYETDKNGPNSTETPEFSLSKFLEYLKSGFGLMGSNGLFAFFARSFNYIPSQIWSLITAGVACMIVVGIINFALKR